MPQYEETLPNGVNYRVLDTDANGRPTTPMNISFPPDHYFMMGDNRDNSQDSRYPERGGLCADRELRGPGRHHLLLDFARHNPLGSLEVAFEIRWSRFFNFL